MKVSFKDLPINGKYKEEYPASYPYLVPSIKIYEKKSKSIAVCIHQEGCGNTRAVGGQYKIASNKIVMGV